MGRFRIQALVKAGDDGVLAKRHLETAGAPLLGNAHPERGGCRAWEDTDKHTGLATYTKVFNTWFEVDRKSSIFGVWGNPGGRKDPST